MNIFIAGISYNLSNADLGELFEEFGEVISAKIRYGQRNWSF